MIFPRIIDNGIAKQWEGEVAYNTKRLIVKALTCDTLFEYSSGCVQRNANSEREC